MSGHLNRKQGSIFTSNILLGGLGAPPPAPPLAKVEKKEVALKWKKNKVIKVANYEAHESIAGRESGFGHDNTWTGGGRAGGRWVCESECMCLRASEMIKTCQVSPETTSGDLKKIPLLWWRLGSAATSCFPPSQLSFTENHPPFARPQKRQHTHTHTNTYSSVSCPACPRLLKHIEINRES